MVIREKGHSEKAFQENFVKELKKYKWKAPDFLDGNKQKVTIDTLIDNWRCELNRINADMLEGVKLTDSEFSQVMAKVNKIGNSYEASKILSMENSTGKIDEIFRDDNPKVTRKQITLTIFKKAEVRGGDSSYQIAREVETKNGNRFDIVLLINGLPLINIEQKRVDKTLDEAFAQFRRYYLDGEYTNNFMAFSQMMIINSEIETRYFATPKSEKHFNKSFVFHWSDKANKTINNWQKVVENFLMIPMAHQMVGDYLIIDEAKEEENRRHMLMRPYQVYALQSIEKAAFGWDNKDKIPHGGFVWHTTGSGKTITSFKTALFLSTRAGFDKVIFLVDRRELDNRTSENFKAYAAYEPVEVDDTKNTYQLKKNLKAPHNGIVVTTTFKLNSLVKEMIDAKDEALSNKKFIFIIDEAHRSTMGQMMGNIKDYFKKNGLFYGFTGTPLFDENKAKGKVNEKSEVINTTEKLFGPKLHQYTIDEAIADKNVLGFHVDYLNTGEFIDYNALREALIKASLEENQDTSKREVERAVYNITELEVEKEACKKGILKYQDETHIPRVVKEILDNLESQSQNREFNAILTVQFKERVIAYYNEFKKQIAESGKKINIAMTFSFGNENHQYNEEKENKIDPNIIKEMFKNYGEFTGIEFTLGDKRRGEDAYFEDVVERATRGGSGRNPKNIDIVIVADQLLTGYDSKRLNTLYVDRPLELQGLIQAYSRTNRVFGKEKEFGTIINFKYPKITEENVNKALELYGSGGKSTKAIVDNYNVATSKFKIEAGKMITALKDPTEWQMLERDEDKRDNFIDCYKSANIQLNKVVQYYEYKWNDESFGLTEHIWMNYVGAYRNLTYKKGEVPEIDEIIPLVSRTKLAGTQVIDAPHILSLIGEKVISSKNGFLAVDDETLRIIHEQIQELSNMGDHEHAKLLKEFVDTELVEGKVSSSMNFDVAFEEWKSNLEVKDIEIFSLEWGVKKEILKKSVNAYSLVEPEEIPFRDEIITTLDFENATKGHSSKLKHNMQLNKELKKWMTEIKQKYS